MSNNGSLCGDSVLGVSALSLDKSFHEMDTRIGEKPSYKRSRLKDNQAEPLGGCRNNTSFPLESSQPTISMEAAEDAPT